MEKKRITCIVLIILLSIPAYSDVFSHTEELTPKHSLIPIEELSQKNQDYVDFLDSIFFEKTSFIGKEYSYFIDKMSRIQINDDIVAFSTSEVAEKRIKFTTIQSEAFKSDRVNFESRKISYLQAIDTACAQLHAVWTVDDGQIYIMPTKMKFEIRKNQPSTNPFDS